MSSIRKKVKKIVSKLSRNSSNMAKNPSKFNLSVKNFSHSFWATILQSSTNWSDSKTNLIRSLNQLDELRTKADFNTGSIPAASAWCLYSLVRYFKVDSVLEVGTFIGKSTVSIALAIEHENLDGIIHTCDGSNSIAIPHEGRCKIVQYFKQTSTEMLQSIQGHYNFAHFDGRVQRDDLRHLQRLLLPNSIIALDDFEGMEKGVCNLMLMREHNLIPDHILVYPCQASLTKELGFSDQSTTAVLLPKSLINYTNQ